MLVIQVCDFISSIFILVTPCSGSTCAGCLNRFFHIIFKLVDSVCICCPLQALEEEFTRKLQEQEVFFKMSGESECLNPTTQSRVSKFYPIPNLNNSGL